MLCFYKFWASRIKLVGLLVTLLPGCNPSEDGTLAESIFVDVTDRVGLVFIHDPAVDGSYFMPESIGAGAAFLDYDNDGDLDIYLINGAHHDRNRADKPALKNRLYRQDQGMFTDVTDAAGLGDTGYGMGVACGDIDNDGDVDVYVSNYGPDALFRNNGDGTFTDISKQAGILNPGWGCSVIFFDYNRDSFLDIYVTNYLVYDPAQRCSDRAGRQDYCGPTGFAGAPDVLYHNNGDGTFTDASRSSKIAQGASKGLGVVTADFNGDALPDIYVSNDGEANQLWLNQGDGTFEDRALFLGVALNDLGRPEAGMGIALGDADNDGDLDLFITHLRDESNTLYRYAGEYGFQDDSGQSGLAGPSLPLTGFGAGFLDFDHDGDLDLAIANGRVSRGPRLASAGELGYWAAYAEPNVLFENDGQGHFQKLDDTASDFATRAESSRGLAFGDVDNDGDIDMLLSNEGGQARLFINSLPKKGNWLVVTAIDPAQKRIAIGAKITLQFGAMQISRFVTPGYSYLSSNDPRTHFGLGQAASVDQITVTWPGGIEQTFPGVRANQMVVLRKGEAR